MGGLRLIAAAGPATPVPGTGDAAQDGTRRQRAHLPRNE
ncbi:hypothetical protein SAMN05414137_11385 [Streptacidiphilus jiangxiensis]|uniref:Uncharacterized protein n=1 Tax=Streptacidiphilus jiangxiensis TaxID=235985 RepID=A0A1H7T551_STRJI|nr:hypothetical protein SAMN05414137_11385 [Streptacidiphilus jiangxiensis]